MAKQKARSRAGARGTGDASLALDTESVARLQHLGVEPTDDSDKFHGRDIRATIRAIWNGQNFDEHSGTRATQRIGLVLDRTNFYAEMGGQVAWSRRGTIPAGAPPCRSRGGGEFRIEGIRSVAGFVLHVGHAARGQLRVGDDVQLHIENKRRHQVSANHTATHLLNFGLREVLGDGVDQKGSLVAEDRLRFDFNHSHPVTPEQLEAIQTIVRDRIEVDLKVYADEAPLMVAKAIHGLRAVFGETYPDPVRVVSIGVPVRDLLDDPERDQWRDYSIELCGGTHLQSTGKAGAFAIVLELVPAELARKISKALTVPTIGIGAGPYCDGQVQVLHDVMGMYEDFVPKHTKRYAKIAQVMRKAAKDYLKEVRMGVRSYSSLNVIMSVLPYEVPAWYLMMVLKAST